MVQSELRKGNYVLNDREVVQVRKLDIQSEPSGCWASVDIGGCYTYPSYLNPIPLNEDWLRKLGFTIEEEWKSKSGRNFYMNDRNVVVGFSSWYGITIRKSSQNSSSDDIFMVQYVHELQNIFKELTGNTLE